MIQFKLIKRYNSGQIPLSATYLNQKYLFTNKYLASSEVCIPLHRVLYI